MAKKKQSIGDKWAERGIACAILSLLILPPLFILLGIIFGCIALYNGSIGKGLAAVILSIVLGLIGMFIGAVFWLFV